MTSALSEPSADDWTDFELALSKAGVDPVLFAEPQLHLEAAGWDGVVFRAGIEAEQLQFLTERLNAGWRPSVEPAE